MVVKWGDRRLLVCALCCNHFRIFISQVSVYGGCRLVIAQTLLLQSRSRPMSFLSDRGVCVYIVHLH